MQQFTRSLTREIEVGGERLAVTLSKEGLSVRPVGGRRPPHNMSWEAWVCTCVAQAPEPEPTAPQIQEALKAVRAGGPKMKEDLRSPSDSAPVVTSAPVRHDLSELLSRVDKWIATHRPRFQHALLPGATPAECDALAAALGRTLPEELRTWLTWHNGQKEDVPGTFEQNWILMSAQQIADAKKELDAQSHEGWQQAWVPFLDDDNGNYLCLDLDSPGCPVRECWRGRSDHPVVAPSLSAWLTDFVSALEQDAYVEDPERGAMIRRG